MAVGVKILLACLLATHVASQVLANSVLAQQYPQEMNILQASEQECSEILLENGNVTYSKSNTNTTPGYWPHRTVASLCCNKGYALLYDKYKVCLNGSWSGYSSSCVVISCQEKFRDSRGCCTAREKNCFVGSHALDYIRSCSANCYDNPYIPCSPDIGCPRGCSKAGLIPSNSNFCSWSGTGKGDDNCYLPNEHCFCDEECCKWKDCCSDVGLFCPIVGTSQVRTEDSAVKELASELRSMSQVQELSNELQRAGWEAILRELQEIQKEE